MKKIFLVPLTLLLIASPFFVQAQVSGGINPVTPATDAGAVARVIQNIFRWAFGILLFIAALFIIYAAFLYLTSAGDEGKLKTARNYIIYAIVAIVVGFLSQALVALVRNIIGT